MHLFRVSLAVSLVSCVDPEPKGDDTDTGDPGELVSCAEGGEAELVIEMEPPDEAWRLPPEVVISSAGVEVARASGSTTLTLPSGRYTAEIWRGETGAAGAIGDLWIADQPIVSLCLDPAGSEQLSVELARAPGHLWVSSGESLGAFTSAQLEAGGPQTADLRLDIGLVNDFRGFAFDRMGHLWAAAGPTYGTRLLMLSPSQLSGSGAAEPSLTLSSPVFGDFAQISDLLFDAQGTLWAKVASGDGSFHGLAGFSRATLGEVLLGGQDAEVEPDWVRTVDGLTGAVDLELGPDGALWLSAFDLDALLRIDDPRDGLTGSDAQLQVFTHPSTAGEPLLSRGPENLAFQDDGGAVALFWTSSLLLPLPATGLLGAGAQELLVEGDDLYVDQLPTGLVIDATGQVWVGNYAGDGLGQILSWAPGEQTVTWLTSEELPDPADLVLDPSPR